MNDSGGAVIFHGTKDTLVCGCYGANPWLLSGREIPVPTLTREVPENNHYTDFIRACKESPENRVKTASDFSEAGPLNEMVVMGVLAVRLQGSTGNSPGMGCHAVYKHLTHRYHPDEDQGRILH
jgi:hypothetical protein